MKIDRKRTLKSSLLRRLLSEQLEDRRLLAAGPYAPAAGQEGSTAIADDSTAIVAWATSVESYSPGAEVDIAFQTPERSLGAPDGTPGDVVSLGRGGEITLQFENPIRDGLGPDFAVFENGFSDTFLELAFVEVSSNGTDFVRFTNDSLTDGPVDTFGAVDPTEINNLAGKFRHLFGTPFDLSELVGADPNLDVNRVTHVRLVDIVGDGSATDSSGDVIYDPFPTTGSAGFDLDAIAVLNQSSVVRDVIDFEDVGQSLSAESAFIGPVSGGTNVTGPFGDMVTVGEFDSGTLTFNNAHSLDFGSWNQWGYSNSTDTTTPGFTNQFSSFAGGGADDSDTFGILFVDQSDFFEPPTISRPDGDNRQFESLRVTNTTFTALSVRDGDSFAKMFGGPTGDDPDFLLLTITGKSDVDTVIGTIDFYLADFRFEDNTQDFIVDQWTEVDLTSIADAAELEFSITSSDVGPFGLNTPAYAAIDDITLVAPALSVDIANAEVSESSGTDATTVRISRPEADAGAVVVAIEPVDPSIATVPTLVTIEAGEQFVDFTIDVIGNEISGPDQTIAISASAVGFVSSSKSLVIVDDDQPTLTVNLDSTLVEGETLTATVVRSGVDLTSPLSVEVQADDSGLVTVDQTVVIPAGLSSQTFTVEAIDDSTVRPTTTVELLVSATDFESGLASFEVTDNDQPSLFAEFVPAAVSESVSGSVATFEDFGASLTSESFYNGSDGAGGFTSGELAFNNSYNFDFDVFSGWAVSNTTDVTTPGFTNQYSAFTGAGAFASDSYAVAAAFITPTITRDESSGSFQSIEITNTTFAALSILQGDSFAKQFGGDSGDDPDFFLLTIEGFDSSDDSVGTIDFYLADYRFEDNSQDFIVDSWTTVDLSPLGDATELQFSLSSSDVGDFGINTPAYFAVDNVTLASETSDPMLRISRNTTLNSEALPVQLTVDSANSIVVPEFVEIPANQTSVSVPVRVVDDLLFGVDQLVSVTADAENHTSSTSSLNIIEDDQATITLSVLDPSVSEASGLGRLVVYRNSVDLSSPLQVNLSVDAENQITIDSQVTIPAGSRSFEIEFLAVDNDQVDEDRQILVTGSAIGFLDGQSSFEIIDDEQALSVQFDVNSISESDALPTATFEELGARLASESFDNGSDLSGGFTSGPLDLNNVFDPTFGSWSGWSISNTTDTTTPGFGNQFSAFTGSGALGSDTYAVANAFPGGTVPTLSRNDGGVGFESLLVTNTTFAAQSILQGDSFARQFGGESGNDPDFFLLHIEGFDSAEQSVGVIDFYLADYRFNDNSLDFLVDEWTTVDLSGLTNAVELQFSLTSSDVGAFGLNTPAFFAVDQVSVSEPNANSITGTVSRSGDDLSEPLTVELQSDATEVSFPSTVVIAAGESSASFAVAPVDDALVDGDQTVDLILSADSFQEATTSITVVDDDEATLTLTLSNSSVSESDGDQAATLLVHRNSADLDSPLQVDLSFDTENQITIDSQVTIPVGSRSVELDFSVLDNDQVDEDRQIVLTGSATGFLDGQSSLEIINDDEALSVQFDVDSISESDALPTATFEELGARLASESFDNGSDLSGGFTSGPLDLNNVFDPTFGSWSGWSISNTTDTTTPGFGNQFSAFTGSGALGSDTYAVANAFPGGTVPTLSRNDGGVGFESLLVTNTTFAAQSILQGDSFARQFGGESGNDPDFFLLHIEGFDSAEQSVGVIDFYLADYRFNDNSLDFLVDEWTTVDLSGLTNAVELQFSLTSSDVGAFGLNTPAFFAVDQVSVSEPNANSITGTVSRSGDDLSEPLTVELQSDATEVSFPSTVVIAAGESSASFAVAPVDDALVDGDQTVDLILSADSFQEATTSITVVDDDEATLTLTLSNSSVSESDGDQAATLLVHRNTLRDVDSPTINLVGSDDFSLGDDVTIPANSASVEVTVGVVDNDRVDGDRELSIIASAAGFLGSSSALTVQDDEVAGFTVIETGDGTTVDERSGEDQIQVVLAAEPLSDVVVDLISSSGDVRSSLDQLTFTPANWNQPQFVTIIGVPDLTLGDSPVDFSFTINGEQSNALFVDLGDQSVSVTVIDHQPDSIVLEVGQGEIVLTDLAREIEFGRSDESGIQVVGNELTQGLFIEDLSPVAVDVDVDVDVDLAGGDDDVTLFGSAFTSIEGGEGHDRLIIGLTGEIGLVEFLRDRVTGFEEVQLGDDVILTIDTANLDQVTGTENTLLINVTGDELVRFEGTGQQIEPLIVEDRLVQVIQFGEQFIQLLTNRPLQNGFIRHDVDQSGSVTASDALSIINELAIAEESESPPVVDVEDFEGNFYDVNGDNRVTALDALQVINELARQSLLVDSEAVAFAPAPNDDDDEEFGSSINSEAVDFIFGELF